VEKIPRNCKGSWFNDRHPVRIMKDFLFSEIEITTPKTKKWHISAFSVLLVSRECIVKFYGLWSLKLGAFG